MQYLTDFVTITDFDYTFFTTQRVDIVYFFASGNIEVTQYLFTHNFKISTS